MSEYTKGGMKLKKAIEILSDEPETLDWENEPQAIEALKLGTEALKRIQHLRGYSMTQVDTRLPGEAED